MTEQTLNTASLFQTSLRRWQAEWRAAHGDAAAAPASVGRRLIGAAAARRPGRRAAKLVSAGSAQQPG